MADQGGRPPHLSADHFLPAQAYGSRTEPRSVQPLTPSSCPVKTDVWSIHILQRRIQRNVGCGDIKVSVMCGLLFHITARFDGFTGS